MTSTVTLDRSDTGVDEMVSGWKNGGEYELHVKVKQISSNPQQADFEITGIVDQHTDENTPEDETDNTDMGDMGEKPSVMMKSMGGKMPAMKY